MGLKVLVLACRKTGYESIKHILDVNRHTITGVFTEDYDNLVNNGISSGDYAELLAESGVKLWKTDRLHDNDVVGIIRELSPDIGLSIGWRRLVKEPVISIPALGFYNFHTSELPKYRGFASTSWALLNGDSHIAITAHKMLSGIADEGDIYLKEKIPITDTTDIGTLFNRIESIIPGMVHEFLDKIESGALIPLPQDEKKCVLSLPRVPSDGWIDWSKPAVEIDRLVRSVSKPYPGAFTCLNMKKIIVWKGYVLSEHPPYVGVPGHVIGSGDNHSVRVLTGDGVYVITEIQLEKSGDAIPPANLIKGVQQRLGLTSGELFEVVKQLWDKRDAQ